MKFNRILAGAALALAWPGPTPAAPAPAAPASGASASARADSDLPADERVRFGTLANGMRYAIVVNATPAGEASLRLRIGAGSLEERDDQRGLAHFLEHMVLNGTRHVPEGEFVRRLEREGLKFGPDTNASTSFDQTVYMLDLARSNPEKLETALFLLREVAGEATLETSAIDRERGIILSEERSRAGPQYRILIDELGYLFRGDLLPDRLPIGTTESVRTVPRERLADFYDRYYRPERAMLIAVGDFDADLVEARIRALFGDWKGRGPAGPDAPPPGKVARGPESRVIVEPGSPNRVSLAWVTAPDLGPDNRAARRRNLVDRIALTILNRRLERLATTPAPPFVGASASLSQQADRARVVQVSAIAQTGRWREALAAIEQESRRAAQRGFAPAELDREIAGIRVRLQAAVAGASTRSTPAIAQALVSAANERDVFTSPATDLASFEAAAKDLTAHEVSAAAARLFVGGGPLLYLSSPVPVEGGEAALTAAYAESKTRPVGAALVQAVKLWPYTRFGAPGAVVERRSLPGLDSTAVRFANGVRLTVKPTAFKKDQVLVSVRFGTGQLGLPRDRADPLWAAMSGGFVAGGLGRLTAEEMKQVLAGTLYGVDAGEDDDSFTLAGATRSEDFERQMQVLAAYLADPGWRPTGFERLRQYSATLHEQMAATPAGVFGRDAGALLRSGDLRWATPGREEMAATNVANARRLLAPALARGVIEVIVVGDVTVEEAIRRTAATFGALPRRRPGRIDPAALAVRFPPAGLVTRTHKGRADQGLASIAWPTADFYSDTRRSRTLNLLGQVLQLRLTDEIREKQGTTYSPSAGHSPSDVFPGYGYLAATIEAPPEKLDGFFSDAFRVARDLRERPVEADELERARRPLVDNLLRQRLGNAWWLSQLAGAAEHPERRETILNAVEQYRAITAADLQKAARNYLDEAKAWRFKAVPEAAGKP
jgi:zinc protease